MKTLLYLTISFFLFASAPALAQDLGGFFSPGELSRHHQKVNGISQCVSCHELGVGLSPTRCMACHEHVEDQVKSKTGFHSDKGKDCASCHADHRGAQAQLISLKKKGFEHDQTGFELLGAHGELECKECHEDSGTWLGLDELSECADCHQQPHGAEKSNRSFLSECTDCHSETKWDGILPLPLTTFDHQSEVFVDFKLKGRHKKVDCEDCHEEWRFVPTKADACEDCHENMHGAQFKPRTCDTCHSVHVADFALRNYDHDTTDFALVGQHRQVHCESCHGDRRKAKYVDLPHETCGTCHEDPHNGQFQPKDCDDCHSIEIPGFQMLNFNHDETDFPLLEKHKEVSCNECHGDGPASDFAGLKADSCSDCHEDKHEKRFDPSPCTDCHTSGRWPVESFDHDRARFTLLGAHTEVECSECHGASPDRVLYGVAFDTCMDCHADDEPHEAHLSGETCTNCHANVKWTELHFNHSTTDFKLTGQHEKTACMDCHSQADFTGQKTKCSECHSDTKPRDHYDGACSDCHNTIAWSDATLSIQQHAKTGFPLKGRHKTLSCMSCHTPGLPTRAAVPECIDCHQTSDPHRNQLGDQCQDCHTEVDWFRVRFQHASTGWPLRGAHKAATCSDCHAMGFSGTTHECRSCHETRRQYDSLHADPITNDCELCHRPYDWGSVRTPHGDLP